MDTASTRSEREPLEGAQIGTDKVTTLAENGASDALRQLSGKRRTYEDLSRFLKSRLGDVANYTLLLGAGCSVSSNIRSASELVEVWRQETFARLEPEVPYNRHDAIDRLTKTQGVWYNAAKEYSSLFEKNFDLPRQRRMFVEQEVSNKTPNLGYAYLTRLVEQHFVNTVFTTNFDDLLNEAFFQFSDTRPVVCAHDSAIASIAVTSKRPKIIKLHGDYLFDDIKATVRETESLEENTRRKLIEFGREFGLIVVGYGGGDRSVMDVLQYLLRSDDYFKHGVYWCIRKGDAPSDDLLKLLWRDRVYFVEIDGFDELMAQLYHDLIGKELPIDTSAITSKPQKIIDAFCENRYLLSSKSEVITNDLDRLRKQRDREQLLTMFRDARYEDSSGGNESSDLLNDVELAALLQIRESMSAGDLSKARSRIREAMLKQPSQKFREDVQNLLITIEELAGDHAAANAVANAMIEEDTNNVDNYIRKAGIARTHKERIAILDSAFDHFPDEYRLINRRLRSMVDAYGSSPDAERMELYGRIIDDSGRSLALEPGPRNSGWLTMIAFFSEGRPSKEVARQQLDQIVSRTAAFGRRSLIHLGARVARFQVEATDAPDENEIALWEDIEAAIAQSSKAERADHVWFAIDAARDLGRLDVLARRICDAEKDSILSATPEFLRHKGELALKLHGDAGSAAKLFAEALSKARKVSRMIQLAECYVFLDDPVSIGALIASNASILKPTDRLRLEIRESGAKHDYEGALVKVRSLAELGDPEDEQAVDETHLLIQLKRYPEAMVRAKQILEHVKWSKASHGALIVNYELAAMRHNQGHSKARLGELTENQSVQVRICAYFMLKNDAKARTLMLEAIRKDRSDRFTFRNWAIFQDDSGKNFLAAVLKGDQ
jgi:NAD-dependent SIR2 family protein deacetylase